MFEQSETRLLACELIDQFSLLAESALPRLKLLREWRKNSGAEQRAFIIEFAGMPKAGKTEVIKTIRHYFLHGSKDIVPKGYRVHTPAEGVSLRTPNELKGNLADYNTWAGAYAVQELLQAQHDRKNHLVILDRGPWDAGCWLDYVMRFRPSAFGDSDDVKAAVKIVEFFQSTRWVTQADLHVVLVVDPEEAAKREAQNRLIQHKGPAQDIDWMAEMKKIYTGRFKELQNRKAAQCPHVGIQSALLIDTTDKKRKEVAWEIIDRALTVLDLKLQAKMDASMIWEGEVWKYVQPYVERYVRKKEVTQVRSYLPEFLREVNSSTDARNRLRKAIKDIEFTLPPDEQLAANRGEAKMIIKHLHALIDEHGDEL